MKKDELYMSLLSKYCKQIVHMRQQYNPKVSSLGIVLGSGINKEIGLPDWNTLISRIACNNEMPEIIGDNTDNNITNAQLLFQAYKNSKLEKCKEEDKTYNRIEMRIHSGWKRIIHSALYKDSKPEIREMVPKSHYLWNLVKIVKKIPMTINYNFDDTIERLISATRTKEEREENRGYTTLWNQNVHVYPRNSVIYHPNGFLPYKISEHPSETIVLLEDSFADQLIDSMHGRYNILSEYFAQNTCLLIGLSLNDPTLKHLLRNNAVNNPGMHHYYVKHIRDSKKSRTEKEVVDANFDVYNLVTMFLTNEEIGALLDLIQMNDEKFGDYLDQAGISNSSYKYILVGSVAVGKSTAMSYFHNIATQDEWIDSMPEDMALDPSEVNDSIIQEIDEWVAEQWGKKNAKLLRAPNGLHIMDRGPLDAFAFTPRNEWKKKADLTKKKISPGKSKRKLCSAEIILLVGDPNTMASRAILNHKTHKAKKLEQQQKLLEYVYNSSQENIRIIDTRNKGKAQVAKEIARIIFLDDYREIPLNDILENVLNGCLSEPVEML